MAAITMPSFGDDDLYLYMREIVENEFPKALRQACKPLWDEKHALGNGHSCHCDSCRLHISLVSKPLEKLDFYELCRIMTNSRFPGLANYTKQNAILGRSRYHPYHNSWHVFSRDPGLPNVDERSLASAIDKLRDLKVQYVDIKGYTSPQLLRQQLAQARGAFMTLGITLNDSRNAISFSAAGLQDLIPKSQLELFEPLPLFSEHGSDLLCSEDNALDTAVACERTETSSLGRRPMESLEPLFRFSEHRSDLLCSEDNALDTAVPCEWTETSSLERRAMESAALKCASELGSLIGDTWKSSRYFPAFSSEQERRDFNIWIKGKYLGGGNFGKVFSLTHRETGIKVATKEVKMEPQYSKMPEEVKQLQNEIYKLSWLRHPRIVRFHGSEQKGDVIYLFLDFMAGGSLHDFIRQKGQLDERLTRKFTQQILEGVDYLHSNEITHRDIKGPNILLDSDRSVKLADFGVSRKIQKIGTKTDLTSYVGTTYWMAPEILWGEGYGRKVDIWSVGCTVVEMLTGNPPLKNLEPQAAMFRIGSKPLEVKLPKGATKEARDFVRAALTWKPEKRPKCKELLTHPFVEIRKKS